MTDKDKIDKRQAWAEDQLLRSELPIGLRTLANKLLDVYWGHTDLEKLTPNESQTLFEVVGSLAEGHTIVEEDPEAVWESAKSGRLVIRDQIRVIPTAYVGSAGDFHNGRVGVITAIRNGRIYVRYTDGGPNVDLQSHMPEALEKRIR